MLEFDPLDEYPIHQVPLPMRYVATSDRNVYDRCIFQGVDHEADAYFITGLGVVGVGIYAVAPGLAVAPDALAARVRRRRRHPARARRTLPRASIKVLPFS